MVANCCFLPGMQSGKDALGTWHCDVWHSEMVKQGRLIVIAILCCATTVLNCCFLFSCQGCIAQEKWSCGGPRPCLAYGLLTLVLLVVRSVRRPSSLDDVIWGSTWNYPDKDPFLYIGICHQHANGQSSNHVHHWNMLF